MKIKITNTQLKDLPDIYEMFDAAIEYQKSKNFPVWPDYDKQLLEDDIKDKKQFKISRDNTLACIFTICDDDAIVWRERTKIPALYLHRVVTHPDHKGHRLFETVLRWTISLCRAKNITRIRMDTWAENITLIEYYKTFGFYFVEYFQNPDDETMPIQQRGNKVILLEYKIPH
ncbi:MAG: GNAT family N-acetyltransferase [Saprospiraceae bacterium]|nr:GNAT family N-acetyltransferase [Saprospiraceae bacterium]